MSVDNFNGTAGSTRESNGLPVINEINTQTFSSSGTYTPTAGMVFDVIEVVGGGGGGGGATAAVNDSAAGGGGGPGAYAKVFATAAQIGSSQTITIGAGGSGGSTAGGNGGNGGTTSVGSLVSCPGGAGGAGMTAAAAMTIAQAGGSITTCTISGVTTIANTISFPGTWGIAYSENNEISGNGGYVPQVGGFGGFGTYNNNIQGSGGWLGGGGAGASTQKATTGEVGGAGGSGYVVITEYISG